MNFSKDLRLVFSGRQQIVNNGNFLLSWLQASIARRRASWVARRKLARDIEELYGSSDRELRDLGLCRSDLREIIAGTYRRE